MLQFRMCLIMRLMLMPSGKVVGCPQSLNGRWRKVSLGGGADGSGPKVLICLILTLRKLLELVLDPIILEYYSTFHNNLLCNFRSEEHTSELQSRFDLVCRLLLEKKN